MFTLLTPTPFTEACERGALYKAETDGQLRRLPGPYVRALGMVPERVEVEAFHAAHGLRNAEHVSFKTVLDKARMNRALKQPSVKIPTGMSPEQIRQFIIDDNTIADADDIIEE